MKGKWAVAICMVLSIVLVPSAMAGASQTFIVRPTGVDDTANLQAAFDAAVAAGPGSVVELAEGHFYLSEPVVVNDFSGTFRGQGSSRSVIHLRPNTLFGLLHEPPPGVVESPMMFFMVYHQDGAALRWESMGFDLVGKTEPWHHPFIPDPYWMDFLWPIWVEGVNGIRDVDTVWWDLRIKGDEGPSYVMGGNAASVIRRYLAGTHRVTNCHFDTMDYGLISLFHDGAKITVGGPRPEDRVTFRNVNYGVVTIFDVNSEIQILNARAWREEGTAIFAPAHAFLWAGSADGLKVHMSGVETDNMSGALVQSGGFGCGTAPSTYLLEHNTIAQKPGGSFAGFEIWETCPAKSQFVIRNNRIHGEGSFLWGPVFAVGARDAVITNNTFTGSGPAAMYLGLASQAGAQDAGLTSNLLVKGNNVQGWKVDSAPCGSVCQGLPLAPIWLGKETSGIVVMGSGNLHTNVFDETDNPDTPKYDGANILVGVNARGAHMGQAIRDAMQQRIAVKKAPLSQRGSTFPVP